MSLETKRLDEMDSILRELKPGRWEFAGNAHDGVEINCERRVILSGYWPAVLEAKLAVLAVNALPALIAELRAWRELFPGETPEQAAEHYVS